MDGFFVVPKLNSHGFSAHQRKAPEKSGIKKFQAVNHAGVIATYLVPSPRPRTEDVNGCQWMLTKDAAKSQ